MLCIQCITRVVYNNIIILVNIEQTIAINKELTVENVVEALKEAGYSNSNRSNLGWVLNVPVDKIKTFEENNPHDIAQVRIEIITHWMKNQPNKWSTIADAAEKLDIKNKAQEIRSKEINSCYK